MATPAGTVYIVDDDAPVRKGLSRLLESAGYTTHVFESGPAFLDRPRDAAPACLVLDLTMPGIGGLELQRAIVERGWVLPIIFLTGHGTVPATVQAMKAGADDFLTKPVDADDLLRAVERALARAAAEAREHTALHELRTRYETLTPREREVMALVVAGLLNKQVAGDLGTAEKTVKVHRARVMAKMQVQSLADLVRAATRLGIGHSPKP